tara:strand:+ start:2581 stop:3108 length:528 start_codon:yes stop_codon:yes gene_type:complete
MEELIRFAESLIGIKYTLWQGGSLLKEPHPFYVNEIPDIEYIKQHGINCAGFINLLRLKSGRNVPGNGDFKGGTFSWFNYFQDKKCLEVFDYRKRYPIGSLLLRNYRSIYDQGHLAVLYELDKNNIWLNNKIIHSYYDKNNDNGRVGISKLGYSHCCIPEGYYEYIVLPENWILN